MILSKQKKPPGWKYCNDAKYQGFESVRAKCLSEVGFEPTPTEVDCDLNAAP